MVNASTDLPPSQAPSLPDDVAALQAMVLAQRAEFAEMQAARLAHEAELGAELAAARAGLIEQRFEIEALKTRLSKLLRLSFGASSEKLRTQVEQLELTLDDIDELLAEIGSDAAESDDAAADADDHEPTKPTRRPLPEALPRDVVEHAAPCCDKTGACLACGGVLRPLGEDVTEILEYVPGSFRVIRHVRPKLSCRS